LLRASLAFAEYAAEKRLEHVIDPPAFAPQQNVDPEITVAHARRGPFPDPLGEYGLLAADGAVAMR